MNGWVLGILAVLFYQGWKQYKASGELEIRVTSFEFANIDVNQGLIHTRLRFNVINTTDTPLHFTRFVAVFKFRGTNIGYVTYEQNTTLKPGNNTLSAMAAVEPSKLGISAAELVRYKLNEDIQMDWTVEVGPLKFRGTENFNPAELIRQSLATA